VNEVKGLEFDDVILYNFFSHSDGKILWKLLENIKIDQKIVFNQDFNEEFKQTDIDNDDIPGVI